MNFRGDSQGNRNYFKKDKIYTSLNSKKVKVFYKDLWYWDSIDVYLLKMEERKKIAGKGVGCCSRRSN